MSLLEINGILGSFTSFKATGVEIIFQVCVHSVIIINLHSWISIYK